MIGLDTNVLIRWLLDEPGGATQSAQAHDIVAQSTDDFHVNLVVLDELIWLLDRTYRVGREGQAALVEAMLDHPRLVMAQREQISAAVAAFKTGKAGLADHLIGALDAAAGCATTLTFDKTAAKGPHFTAIA